MLSAFNETSSRQPAASNKNECCEFITCNMLLSCKYLAVKYNFESFHDPSNYEGVDKNGRQR